MTTTNHAITGAFIATLIRQPLLAIPLAFLSHFVCDAIPHFSSGFTFGKKSMYWYLAGDALCAILAALFLLSQNVHDPVLLAVCGFAAMSPDLAWLYYGIKDVKQGKKTHRGIISRFHSRIQWSETFAGILPELIWAFVLLGAIIKLQ